MRIRVNDIPVECPFEQSVNARRRHDCFGRPRAHLVTESEHFDGKAGCISVDELSEGWSSLNISGPERVRLRSRSMC